MVALYLQCCVILLVSIYTDILTDAQTNPQANSGWVLFMKTAVLKKHSPVMKQLPGASWRWWVGHTQSQHSEVRSSPSLACFHARPSGSIFYEDRRGLHKCAAPYTHRWTAKSVGCSESSQHGAQQAVKAQAGGLRPAG